MASSHQSCLKCTNDSSTNRPFPSPIDSPHQRPEHRSKRSTEMASPLRAPSMRYFPSRLAICSRRTAHCPSQVNNVLPEAMKRSENVASSPNMYRVCCNNATTREHTDVRWLSSRVTDPTMAMWSCDQSTGASTSAHLDSWAANKVR